MELHVQKCQNCGSRHMRNILVRAEEQKVYVQCRQCELLVARYVLSPGGYFHVGREFESFLRSIERDGGLSSGKDLRALFDEVEETSNAEFVTVLDSLRERYGNNLP